MDYKIEYEKSKEVMKELVKRGSITKEFAKAIFPDFDESNGERIRKRIVDILGNDEKNYLEELCWLAELDKNKWNDADEKSFKWIYEYLCCDGLAKVPECTVEFNAAIKWLKRVKERLTQL